MLRLSRFSFRRPSTTLYRLYSAKASTVRELPDICRWRQSFIAKRSLWKWNYECRIFSQQILKSSPSLAFSLFSKKELIHPPSASLHILFIISHLWNPSWFSNQERDRLRIQDAIEA